MSDSSPRSRVPLIALIAGVGLVVVMALIAILVRGGPAQLDADSPEGVVQRYAQAVTDGDTATALTYLVPKVADECERMSVGSEEQRVTLQGTTERDDTARVTVVITTATGSGPLGASEYESEENFDLEKVDGAWLIAWAPWQFAICANGSR